MDSREVELKLRIRPEDIALLQGAPLLGRGKPTTRQLETVYFDTDDLSLRKQAVTLRVRRQGSSFVQTVKAVPAQASALQDRGEWENKVARAHPELDSVQKGEGRNRLRGIAQGDLKPVFASHIRRTTRLLRNARAQVQIEVALDQGEIRTEHGAVLPISELELELKRGRDTGPLYDLALALNDVAPVRLEPRSKAQRGYALVEGAAPGWQKAGRLELPADATVEQALELVVRHCLDHLLANEACALAGDDVEGIHQLRVALRRLRSALDIFADHIDRAGVALLAGEIKWLADACGPARDWDVFIASLLKPVLQATRRTDSLRALAQAAKAARASAYEDARRAIDSPRYTALLLRLGQWLDGGGWRGETPPDGLHDAIAGEASRLLAKRHHQACQRGAGFADLSTKKRHRARIALKKLRYASDFFRSLYDAKRVRHYLGMLGHLQDGLGHLNDVDTAQRLIREIEMRTGRDPLAWLEGAGMVAGWHARAVADQEEALVAAWHKFENAKPFWI